MHHFPSFRLFSILFSVSFRLTTALRPWLPFLNSWVPFCCLITCRTVIVMPFFSSLLPLIRFLIDSVLFFSDFSHFPSVFGGALDHLHYLVILHVPIVKHHPHSPRCFSMPLAVCILPPFPLLLRFRFFSASFLISARGS
ncbi:hypothetical protein DFH11DRAFT_365672 [Phellopilus nigrolimitatus]|nr:hypothetical protein DFH11DRAFT_365672 [Phellopilus nigrolimitatus]